MDKNRRFLPNMNTKNQPDIHIQGWQTNNKVYECKAHR